MTYVATIASGVADLMMPNGLRVQAGDVVLLTDDEFSMLSRTGSANYASLVPAVGGEMASISSQRPVIGYNPYAESDNEPS